MNQVKKGDIRVWMNYVNNEIHYVYEVVSGPYFNKYGILFADVMPVYDPNNIITVTGDSFKVNDILEDELDKEYSFYKQLSELK